MKQFEKFQVAPRYPVYPSSHYGLYLEEYFYKFYLKHEKEFKRKLIPVFWTSLINNPKHGYPIPSGLQEELDKLPKNDYFVVIQHASGLPVKVPKNTLIFSAGYPIGIPIPLLYSSNQLYNKHIKKDIFCSFIGSNTHQIRERLYNTLSNNKDFEIILKKWTYKLKQEETDLYFKILNRSVFSLCPRGFGPTSFRMYESFTFNSIPTYIHNDEMWLPYVEKINWTNIAILIHEKDIKDIKEILKSKTKQEIENYRANIKKVYDRYFTLNGMSNGILEMVNKYD